MLDAFPGTDTTQKPQFYSSLNSSVLSVASVTSRGLLAYFAQERSTNFFAVLWPRRPHLHGGIQEADDVHDARHRLQRLVNVQYGVFNLAGTLADVTRSVRRLRVPHCLYDIVLVRLNGDEREVAEGSQPRPAQSPARCSLSFVIPTDIGACSQVLGANCAQDGGRAATAADAGHRK